LRTGGKGRGRSEAQAGEMVPVAGNAHEALFVGRREQLATLRDLYAACCGGRPAFALVEGEAGIGKSRLVREFVRELATGATTVFGQCSEHVRSPYLGLGALLAQFGLVRSAPAIENGARADAEEKAAFLRSVSHAIRRESLRRPIVCVVEDLQWADAATLELLEYLMHDNAEARLLAIVTVRDEDVLQNPPLAAFRHRASRRRATLLRLAGLHDSETRQLVAQLADRRRLSPETLAQIEGLAEGNPLFAEELTHFASESGSLSFAREMPLSLQAMMSRRLASFSSAEQAVLVRAAIVGQQFDAAVVASIVRRGLPEVLGILQRATEAGIVSVDGDSLTAFRFRHAMIRRALADRLVLGLAAPLHARVAQALERLPNAHERLAELAYHWSSARVAEKARSYNERAAEAAFRMYAYHDAIGFYRAALRWEYPPGTRRAAIYERLGTLLYVEGSGDEPAQWFARCYEEHAARGDRAGMAHALLLLADQHWVDAQTSQSMSVAARAAEILEELDDPELLAEARLSLARYAITLGDAALARLHLHAVYPSLDRLGVVLRAAYREVSAETHAAAGDAQRAQSDAREASSLAGGANSAELVAQIENNLALVAFDLGDLDAAEARHERALAQSRRSGLTWRTAYCALNYAQTRMLQGRLDLAQGLAWEALGCGVTTATFKTKLAAVGIPLAIGLNDRRLLDACADESALQRARESHESQRIAAVSAAFAELYATQGAHDESRRLLADALVRIAHPHRCWGLFAQVARYGDFAARQAMEGLESRAPVRTPVVALYRRFFETLGEQLRAAQSCDGLSDRQGQIARLVAEGRTNRAIASGLNISEHTVEHHLSAIYAKLGLRSRTQLAARIARNGGNPG
jgi:DNA-binding NarL/FixJ family response regulator